MDTTRLNGGSPGGQGAWPDQPPRELALRLADALLYPNCSPEDLWDEIGDWLTSRHVAAPDLPPDHSAKDDHPPHSPKYRSVSQSGTVMNLTRLVYSSRQVGVDTKALDGIMQSSRANNSRDHVTGALVVAEGTFMQLLEGSRSAIGQCFVRIMKDPRHDDIQIVSCGDVTRRLFHDWSMHLVEASQIKQEIMAHYLVHGKFTPSLMSEYAVEDLCRTLSAGNWRADAA
ncbi:MAG: hypothetical protein B7Z10_13085 [Rhodobacterales bacterium 32-66-7]|nr:MAG: hypothetical protein B7Z10_13085 [Rhodobacterales bacterium 32-66-7]